MLASRTFTAADQLRFAAISGDRNPMHLDAIQARRSPAGCAVVHGIHLLLWSLDALAESDPAQPPLLGLKIRFNQFVAVDETVALVLVKRTASDARLALVVADVTVADITIDFGEPSRIGEDPSGDLVSVAAQPSDLALEQMAGLSGRLAFASAPIAIAAAFRAASGWLGPRRLAALAATTLLVGMVCPGLHSIYGTLTVHACDEPAPEDRLCFRVARTDPRFRLVRLAVSGGGLVGTVEGFVRMPPVGQVASRDLAGMIEPRAFAGSTVLVIGGSRGLGEVTAKLLAAGGAKVIITFRVGSADAAAVARDIRAAGGICDTLCYDASQAAGPQLAALGQAPTHAYFFATPAIFRPQAALFDRARLDMFLETYVHGFLRLAQTLRAWRSDVSLFYPSSAYVTERPRGMTEYAMAKAAGETLCGEMNLAWAPLHVTVDRLPRLLTDQTASIFRSERASPVVPLLSVVREVQSWPR